MIKLERLKSELQEKTVIDQESGIKTFVVKLLDAKKIIAAFNCISQTFAKTSTVYISPFTQLTIKDRFRLQ